MIKDKRKRACCRQCISNLKAYGNQLTALDHFPYCVRIEQDDFKAYLAGKLVNVYDKEQRRWFWESRR
ncbi:hypothetical protein QUF72_09755 [Desulfobacterales bacterium HSG2]|nr:hypothetical protein [Desulfobacterales bacterium HSG2]